MSTLSPFRLSLGLAMGGICFASQVCAQSDSGQHIAIKSVGEPLRSAVPALGKLAGLELTVAPDMADQKAVIIVRDQPVRVVMDQVAKVFGGQWRVVGKAAGNHLELERDPAVKEWMEFYRRQHSLAEQVARNRQTEYVAEFIEDMVKKANDPNWKPPEDLGLFDRGLAKFLGTLTPDDRMAVARHIGDTSPVLDGGVRKYADPPVTLSPANMNPAQRGMINGWVNDNIKRFGAFGPSLLSQLDQTSISITSHDACSVWIELNPPNKEVPDGHLAFPAFGQSWDGYKLAEIKNDDLKRRLAGRPVPPNALLGAQFTEDGGVAPEVKFAEKSAASKPVLPWSKDRLRSEFLRGIADELNMNVVADHYTSSARLTGLVAPSPLGDQLKRAASLFGSVFKVDSGYLLARRDLWPDDDVAETPAPLPESWIAAKMAGKYLSLDDIANMAALSEEQLSLLATYETGSLLGNEVNMARFPAYRPLLLGYLALSQEKRKQLVTDDGVALAALPLQIQRAVARLAAIDDLARTARLRVRRTAISPARATMVDAVELVPNRNSPPIRLIQVVREN